MEHPPRQQQAFKDAFEAARRRQLLATPPAILAVLTIATADEQTGVALGRVPLAVALPAVALVLLGVVAFALHNWRCPACRGYLGKGFNPNFCPKCGAGLQ